MNAPTGQGSTGGDGYSGRVLAELVESQAKRIRELEESQAALTRLIVRDMKAPLAGLANLLEMADRTSVKHFKHEAAQYVNDALGATETLEEMVEFLQGVRKMMAGEESPEKRPCDLFSLVRTIAAGLTEVAQAAGVVLEVKGEPGTVICDQEQLTRVIRYLIRDAVGLGASRKTVRVQLSRDNGHIRVSVITERTGGREGETDGLRATYCRLVATAHGGEFGVTSQGEPAEEWWIILPEARDVSVAPVTAPVVASATLPSRRYRETKDTKNTQPTGRRSISSRGTRHQFTVAVALMSAIPLLAFAYLLGDAVAARSFDMETLYLMLPSIVALVGLGILLLARHTIEITRLRSYLERISAGQVPVAGLDDSSEDFKAIKRSLGLVIRQTDDKVKIIEEQSKSLLQAEQQRVMAETVGAACHHLGQPATVIRVYLDIMKKAEMSPEMQGMIQECQSAAEEVAQVLKRLQGVDEYKTEPYLVPVLEGANRTDERILKI